MPRPVKEIGVAKRDVTRARFHLLLNVVDHHIEGTTRNCPPYTGTMGQ